VEPPHSSALVRRLGTHYTLGHPAEGRYEPLARSRHPASQAALQPSTDPPLESPPVATLLTGAGYIGSALLGRLAKRGAFAAPIVVLDNFFSTSREAVEACVPSNAHLVEGDVADPAAVARAFDVLGDARGAVVYHLAAQPSAAIAASDPDTTERSNLVGARVLLEAAHERGAIVVFGGSFRVYGDALIGQTVDEQTPYGRVGDLSHLSKIYVEQLARMMSVRFVSVRLGVTYGLAPIMKTTPAFMTVPNLFCKRAAEGEVLRVLEDRPLAFIHVGDAAEALLAAADRAATASQAEAEASTCADPTGWDVVNAAPEVATVGQVARTVQRLAEERGAGVRIEGAASSEAGFRVRSRLRMTSERSWQTGLGEVLDYFGSHRERR
jgi:nucleoside-diphosphate-sugar epimerase